MKLIASYEIVNHGVERCDSFQGCGVYGTRYDECYTGIGSSLREALEDAAEAIAMSGHSIPYTLGVEIAESSNSDSLLDLDIKDGESEAPDDMHHYASIRIKIE